MDGKNTEKTDDAAPEIPTTIEARLNIARDNHLKAIEQVTIWTKKAAFHEGEVVTLQSLLPPAATPTHTPNGASKPDPRVV